MPGLAAGRPMPAAPWLAGGPLRPPLGSRPAPADRAWVAGGSLRPRLGSWPAPGEAKIRRWIHAARICFWIVFASERRLCERIFEGLGIADDIPLTKTVKGAAIQLFGFAEAISIGRSSLEKLFKVIDLHDTISDLLPDVRAVFQSTSSGFRSQRSCCPHTGPFLGGSDNI